TTFPVILAETVDCRRAVTYPEALSNVASLLAPATSRTSAVRTATGFARLNPQTNTKTSATTTTVAPQTITHRGPVFGAPARSMRSSLRMLLSVVIRPSTELSIAWRGGQVWRRGE